MLLTGFEAQKKCSASSVAVPANRPIIAILTFGGKAHREHHSAPENHVNMAIEQEKDKLNVHKLSLKGILRSLFLALF